METMEMLGQALNMLKQREQHEINVETVKTILGQWGLTIDDLRHPERVIQCSAEEVVDRIKVMGFTIRLMSVWEPRPQDIMMLLLVSRTLQHRNIFIKDSILEAFGYEAEEKLIKPKSFLRPGLTEDEAVLEFIGEHGMVNCPDFHLDSINPQNPDSIGGGILARSGIHVERKGGGLEPQRELTERDIQSIYGDSTVAYFFGHLN